MSDLSIWMRFVLAAFATWRITHLLASEDGPGDIIVSLRKFAGNGFAGKLMDCFYCLSIWIAAPMAFLVCTKAADLLLVWLALSGAACLLERLGQEPVVIHPLPEIEQEDINNTKGETKNGLLRTETGGDQEQHFDATSNPAGYSSNQGYRGQSTSLR